jgi:hypothetical protein
VEGTRIGAGVRECVDGAVISCDKAGECTVAEGSDVREGLGLAAELDLCRVGDVETCTVVTDVGANVPCSGGRLNGRIASRIMMAGAVRVSRSEAVRFAPSFEESPDSAWAKET